mmetsp:Transcript_9021/g.27978  ORF Transcript_9021/g.27978 Transcript_9021/m.27978 type:complete len:202 (+) Transcript_9021:2301-2906(+)
MPRKASSAMCAKSGTPLTPQMPRSRCVHRSCTPSGAVAAQSVGSRGERTSTPVPPATVLLNAASARSCTRHSHAPHCATSAPGTDASRACSMLTLSLTIQRMAAAARGGATTKPNSAPSSSSDISGAARGVAGILREAILLSLLSGGLSLLPRPALPCVPARAGALEQRAYALQTGRGRERWHARWGQAGAERKARSGMRR